MLQNDDYNKMSKPMLIELVKVLTTKLETVTEDLDKNAKSLDEALQREVIYKETIASLNLQIYGRKSEKRTPITEPLPDNTFNDAEVLADPEAPEVSVEEVVKTRNRGVKSKGKRERDLEGLPIEEVVHDIPDDQCTCPECGSSIRCIGNSVRDELVHIPARTFIRRHITPTYTCAQCEKSSDKATIIKADSPKPVIPNSGLASASLISSIIFRKFYMGLPLYRQEKEFKLNNIPVSRQNMANWMIYVAVKYFKPMFELMHEDLLLAFSINCDETPVKVLIEPNRPGKRLKNAKSYFWLFRTGRSEPHSIVLFQYSHSRGHTIPKEFLKGFSNYAHIDGYEAYHCIEGIIWVGCLAHPRRKFMDVYKLIPAKDRGKDPPQLCEVGLNYIDKLFKIEEEYKNKTYEEILSVREELSLPILDEFFDWVNENLPNVTPNSKIGNALFYAHNQEEYLRKYLLDGRLEISNNRAERVIKNVAIGRKNWLFCDTDNGAEASAILYSFVLTAIENSIDPSKYLELVLDELAQITPSNFTTDILRQYLPYSDYIASKCKVELTKPINNDDT